MTKEGLINLDFADVRAIMSEMGKAMMGTGEATGERRAVEAAEAAISNPLLDDISMKGARGVLINITGGMDMTLFEVDEAANRVRDEVDPDANIIFGSTFDAALEGRMRVSVVATGIEVEASQQARPLPLTNPINESARRPAMPSGSRPLTATGGYGASYERPVARQDFGGGIPASILPQHNVGAAHYTTAHSKVQQPVARAPQMEPAAAAPEAPQATMGHAASTAYTAAATARKLNEDDVMVEEPAIKPSQVQTINRPTQTTPHSTQPRAERHGNSFIPPKPVDPRSTQQASSGDLFGEMSATPAAPARAPAAAEKSVKKSPSIFERFTMHRAETPVATEQKAAPKFSVEEGGKQAEDELDIPAFLRRQAN